MSGPGEGGPLLRGDLGSAGGGAQARTGVGARGGRPSPYLRRVAAQVGRAHWLLVRGAVVSDDDRSPPLFTSLGFQGVGLSVAF